MPQDANAIPIGTNVYRGKLAALHILADAALLQVGSSVRVLDRRGGFWRHARVVVSQTRRCQAAFTGSNRRYWFNKRGTHGVVWRAC